MYSVPVLITAYCAVTSEPVTLVTDRAEVVDTVDVSPVPALRQSRSHLGQLYRHRGRPNTTGRGSGEEGDKHDSSANAFLAFCSALW